MLTKRKRSFLIKQARCGVRRTRVDSKGLKEMVTFKCFKYVKMDEHYLCTQFLEKGLW